MKKNFAVICFLLLVPSSVLPQAANTKQRTLALTHVTVIDTTGGPVQSDVTVMIRGQRIVAMGNSGKVPVPEGSQIVDATGKFLIPGLWDMDVYWYDPEEYLPLFIANGVTGVQEALGYADHHEIQKEVEAGRLLAPRMVVGTRWVSGPMPSDPDSKAEILVASEAEARRAVVDAKNYRADFIEVSGIENLPREAFFALADEAKRQGISLQGDVPVFVSLEEASNAGLRSINPLPAVIQEGILGAFSSREADLLKSWQEVLARAFGPNQPGAFDALSKGPGFRARTQSALDTYDQQKANALFAVLKANHTWMCPALIAQHNCAFFDDPSVASDPRLSYMSPGEKSWLSGADGYQPRTGTAEDRAIWKSSYERYFEIMGAMHRAGVDFLAGTGTEEPLFTIPGFSLHDELFLFVQAGFTPLEALQTATLNPARFLGRERDFGTVAPGKMADLVLLDANPLDDIRNTRTIAAVIFRGKFFSRPALDAMLAKIQALGSRESIGDVLKQTIKEKGVEAAIKQYRELKFTHRDSYDFEDKYELSSISHELLYAKKFRDAIPICKLNLETFPRSWWAYDELGEAYMGAGEKDLAIESYKKSLQLDPANQNAALKLKRLNAQ